MRATYSALTFMERKNITAKFRRPAFFCTAGALFMAIVVVLPSNEKELEGVSYKKRIGEGATTNSFLLSIWHFPTRDKLSLRLIDPAFERAGTNALEELKEFLTYHESLLDKLHRKTVQVFPRSRRWFGDAPPDEISMQRSTIEIIASLSYRSKLDDKTRIQYFGPFELLLLKEIHRAGPNQDTALIALGILTTQKKQTESQLLKIMRDSSKDMNLRISAYYGLVFLPATDPIAHEKIIEVARELAVNSLPLFILYNTCCLQFSELHKEELFTILLEHPSLTQATIRHLEEFPKKAATHIPSFLKALRKATPSHPLLARLKEWDQQGRTIPMSSLILSAAQPAGSSR